MRADSKVSDVEAREREAFEAAWQAKNPTVTTKSSLDTLFELRDGKYRVYAILCEFEGWQLARANQQPSAQWIACSERMPEYATSEDILAVDYRGNISSFSTEDFLRLYADGMRSYSYWMDAESLRALLPQSPDTMRKG